VPALAIAFAAVLGLVVGSFLNVVIWRVPRGESVVRPPSHCPACDAPVRPRDNVPVLSWLLLRGRCRDCGAPISRRYPLVEALTAVVFALLAWRLLHLDLPSAVPAYLYLGAISVALGLIDIDVRRLPDVITLPSYGVAAVLLLLPTLVEDDWGAYVRALIGLAALYAFYFVLWFAYPKGMGFGDVKLAGILGLYLGWLGWRELVSGAFLGFFLGGVLGGVMMLLGRANRKTQIPYGPYMLVGALLAVLAGRPLAELYLGTLGR